MTPLVVFGPNLNRSESPTGATFVVHAAGCADCRRFRRAPMFAVDVESRQELVMEIYAPDEFGYDPADWRDYDDLHLAPCVQFVPADL